MEPPVYTDFAWGRIATVQALNGEAASLYDPGQLQRGAESFCPAAGGSLRLTRRFFC